MLITQIVKTDHCQNKNYYTHKYKNDQQSIKDLPSAAIIRVKGIRDAEKVLEHDQPLFTNVSFQNKKSSAKYSPPMQHSICAAFGNYIRFSSISAVLKINL